MTAIEQVCRGCHKVRRPPIEGPCPHCGGYYRTIKKRTRSAQDEDEGAPAGPLPVGALLDLEDLDRHATGLPGLDHVFGGGPPAVGTVLLCAREGTGKTSLLMELLLTMPVRSLLLSTEQDKEEIRGQFGRFGKARLRRASKHMSIESETDFCAILAVIEAYKPAVLALDSLHDIEGICDENERPLSSSTERAVCRVAKVIRNLSRELGFFAFLVGHMANDGTMMGGSHLRHAVGGTLLLDRPSDSDKDMRRILRFRGKTRYGPLGREALFQMTDTGFKDCGPIVDDKDGPRPTGKRPKLRLVN